MALRRKKIACRIYDITKEDEAEILASFVKEAPDYTLGFNFLISTHSFLEPLGIPHIALMVDSATYYPQLINAPHTLACFVESDSCEFIKLFGNTKTLFLPHAIERELVDSTLEEEIVQAKRDFDVTISASYIDPDGIYENWKELFSQKTVAFLDEMVESTLASKEICHVLNFLQSLQTKQEIAQEIRDKELPIFDLINSVEKVMRGRDKIRLLKALNGFHLHIFGSNKMKSAGRGSCKTKKR